MRCYHEKNLWKFVYRESEVYRTPKSDVVVTRPNQRQRISQSGYREPRERQDGDMRET